MAFDKRKSLQTALNYTQQGKWDRAIAEYQSILKADPKDLTVCNNLGDLFARAGKVSDAIEQYHKLGELYRADGLSVKAIAVYKKIAKLDPSLISAHQACADLYWEQGLVGEAKIQMATVVEHYAKAGDRQKLIEAYRRLVQFDPANAAAIGRLADLLLKEGRAEDAAAEYAQAAQTAQAAGQTADAERFLQKARKLAPRKPEENLDLAEALRGEGKLDEAEELLGRLLAARSDNAEAWQVLGEVQTSLGKSPEAVSSLQKAIAHGVPEMAVAGALGQSLLQAGRPDDAIALCHRLSEGALALGDPDRAIAYCRSLLAVSPQLIPLHAHLAGLLQELGRLDEAGPALRDLAATQESAGQTDEAIESYRRLLAIDPTNAEAMARLEALRPSPPTTLGVADLSPAAIPEAMVSMPEEPTLVLEEVGGVPTADTQELPLSGLEDLNLSFGKDEVTLLLEEPAEARPEAIAEPGPSATAEGFGAEGETPSEAAPASESQASPETSSEAQAAAGPKGEGAPEAKTEIDTASAPDWMPEVFEPLELQAQASAAADVPAEWPATDTGFVLDDVPASIGPALHGVELSPNGTPQPDEPLSTTGLGESPETEGFPDEVLTVSLEAVELPAETGLDRQSPDLDAEGVLADQVAEQLAEAEVYQKYGLEEKARERFLEVLRLSPENLTAHLGLKSIYLERRQIDEACAEILTIAQILKLRGDEDGGLEAIREGLALAPDNPEFHRFLVLADREQQPEGNPPAPAVTADVPSPSEPPTVSEHAASPAWKAEPREPLVSLEPVVGAENEAPPPDVPLPLDFEEAALGSPGPSVDLDQVLGPPQEEALPTELQALLDQIEERPAVVAETGGESVDQSIQDEAAEADFYLAQGMEEEALTVLRRMQERDPDHPVVSALARRIAGTAESSPPAPPLAEESAPVRPTEMTPAEEPAAPAAAAAPAVEIAAGSPEETATFPAVESLGETSETALAGEVAGGLVSGGEEREESPAEGEPLAADMENGPLVDGLLEEIREGSPERLGEKDYETHYNLGIAYKEMELFDEAIQEFRLTAGEPKRALESADLIGLCFLAKGQPEQAVQELQAGLAIEGHPPEAYHALRHDLGTAYETTEDVRRALEQFEMLESEGAQFPDLPARIRTLRERLSPRSEPKGGEKPTRKKKKISFL